MIERDKDMVVHRMHSKHWHFETAIKVVDFTNFANGCVKQSHCISTTDSMLMKNAIA